MAALGAMSLIFTPIAAQANTRSGDGAAGYSSAGYASAQSQLATGWITDDDDEGGAGKFVAWFLVGLWATGIAVIIFKDDDGRVGAVNQSPGAN